MWAATALMTVLMVAVHMSAMSGPGHEHGVAVSIPVTETAPMPYPMQLSIALSLLELFISMVALWTVTADRRVRRKRASRGYPTDPVEREDISGLLQTLETA